jgi:hypothetical protein
MGSGRRCTRYNNVQLPATSSQTESHQNERDHEAMQGYDCMVEGRLIRIVWYYLYQQDALAHSIRISQLNELDLE